MSFDLSSAPKNAFPVPDIVPVFPLPTVVFFPETYLPLHIFEPRYREMIEDASQQGQCIGMALLKEGWEDQYHQAPSFHPVGCVGRIISCHKLSDGRSNIVLQGLQRCHYEEQTVTTLYRQARVKAYSLKKPVSLNADIRVHLEQVAQESRPTQALQYGLHFPFTK